MSLSCLESKSSKMGHIHNSAVIFKIKMIILHHRNLVQSTITNLLTIIPVSGYILRKNKYVTLTKRLFLRAQEVLYHNKSPKFYEGLFLSMPPQIMLDRKAGSTTFFYGSLFKNTFEEVLVNLLSRTQQHFINKEQYHKEILLSLNSMLSSAA